MRAGDCVVGEKLSGLRRRLLGAVNKVPGVFVEWSNWSIRNKKLACKSEVELDHYRKHAVGRPGTSSGIIDSTVIEFLYGFRIACQSRISS